MIEKKLYNYNMKNLREVIAGNIISLRKQQGMTQADLAKQVNYSDKAVSRWEKGEVVPDIETLQKISEALNVPLEYLLQEHNECDAVEQRYILRNEIAFKILTVLAVWIVATMIFVLSEIYYDYINWKIYVWAVPISCIALLYLNRKEKNALATMLINTLLCWSLITCFFIQFFDYQAWIMYIVGIPIQAAIIISYLSKRAHRNLKKCTKQKETENK